jgi:hypothetical protein
MSAPLLLLDVDGVVNAIVGTAGHRPYGQTDAWIWTSHVAEDGVEYPIMVSRVVLTFIREAHETGMAEVRWLTTWEGGDAVLALARHLGLPEFAIEGRQAEFPGKFSDFDHWWKLPVVERLVERDPGRPLVWVDDDIPFSRRAERFLLAARRTGVPLLTIAPKTRVGLTLEHLEEITAFLESHRAAVTS